METVKEDYVSFETAKLLKEKGFDVPFYFFYRTDDELIHHAVLSRPISYSSSIDDEVVSAPTLQMAMKWLRNSHGWFIHIDVIREVSCWLADIQDIKNDVDIYPVNDEFSNYEEACEAAIKYCLENLI